MALTGTDGILYVLQKIKICDIINIQSIKGDRNMPQYVVLQVTLKEKFIGTSSRNLGELERVINEQAAKGYRLHTISTASAHSSGFGGGDRIQATMVFEKI